MKERILILLCITLLVCFTGCGNKTNESDKKITKNNIIAKINDIKKIAVFDANNNGIKTISNKEDIRKIVNIISLSTETKENVEHEGNTWFISMYDNDSKLICTISMWQSGYLGLSKTAEKEYKISAVDVTGFKKLLKQ